MPPAPLFRETAGIGAGRPAVDRDAAMNPLLRTVLAVVLWLAGLPYALAQAPVDINSADAAALDRALVNVGPAKAAAIIEYRRAHGPFRSVDQLALVKGIGLKTIERNRGRIVLGAARTAPRKAPLGGRLPIRAALAR